MDDAIETRELITLDGGGVRIRGTYHRPHDYESRSAVGLGEPERVGILFLNSLALPRAATGDSSVYWADSFAKFGYPAFRIDLPGLGDSDGETPMHLLGFINSGRYAPAASTAVREVVERYGLLGVIIVGHCAGTVSALYTAAASAECCGLILMDPYFHLPPQVTTSRVWKMLGRWASRNKVGGLLSDFYDRLKDFALLVRRSAPPRNANYALLNCWKELASAGLPILLLKAPGRKTPSTKPRVGDFDYLRYVQRLAGRRSQVTVSFIDGTDHSFANRIGRSAIVKHAERWLVANFPLSASGDIRPQNQVRSTASSSTAVLFTQVNRH